MLSLIEFLTGDYPPDYAEDIQLPAELTVYDKRGAYLNTDATGDVLCGRTPETLANYIALELIKDPDNAIKNLATMQCDTASLHDIYYSIPPCYQLSSEIGKYLASLVTKDMRYAHCPKEQFSAFKLVCDTSSPPLFTKFASKLAAIYYYQIPQHSTDPIEPKLKDRLLAAIAAHFPGAVSA